MTDSKHTAAISKCDKIRTVSGCSWLDLFLEETSRNWVLQNKNMGTEFSNENQVPKNIF